MRTVYVCVNDGCMNGQQKKHAQHLVISSNFSNCAVLEKNHTTLHTV